MTWSRFLPLEPSRWRIWIRMPIFAITNRQPRHDELPERLIALVAGGVVRDR
jgi:hypothetical protein